MSLSSPKGRDVLGALGGLALAGAVNTAEAADLGTWDVAQSVDAALGTDYDSQGQAVAFAGTLGGHGYLSVYEGGSYKVKETDDGLIFTDVTADIQSLDPSIGSRVFVSGWDATNDSAVLSGSGDSFKIDGFDSGVASWTLTETANHSSGLGSIGESGDVIVTRESSGSDDHIYNETTGATLLNETGDQTDGIINEGSGWLGYMDDSWYARIRDMDDGSDVTVGDLYSWPTQWDGDTLISVNGVSYTLETVDRIADVATDSDGDGVADEDDDFPADGSETTDTDGDGVGDNADAFDSDPTETMDRDSDGVGDNADCDPMDATETLDTDEDGICDNADDFPEDPTEDLDSDGDGVGDNADDFPENPDEDTDTDGDGTGDNSDTSPTVPNYSEGAVFESSEGSEVTVVTGSVTIEGDVIVVAEGSELAWESGGVELSTPASGVESIYTRVSGGLTLGVLSDSSAYLGGPTPPPSAGTPPPCDRPVCNAVAPDDLVTVLTLNGEGTADYELANGVSDTFEGPGDIALAALPEDEDTGGDDTGGDDTGGDDTGDDTGVIVDPDDTGVIDDTDTAGEDSEDPIEDTGDVDGKGCSTVPFSAGLGGLTVAAGFALARRRKENEEEKADELNVTNTTTNWN